MRRKWIKITLILVTVLGIVALAYFIRQIYICLMTLFYFVILIFMYGGY